MTARFHPSFRVTLAAWAIGCSEANAPNRLSELWINLESATDLNPQGQVGTAAAPVPTVRTTDSAGRPLANVAVLFDVSGGGGIDRPTVQTNTEGIATVGRWVLGPTAGLQTVTARLQTGPTVVFTATAIPGPPDRFAEVTGSDQIGPADVTLPRPLRLRVADQFGNAISGVNVNFGVLSGGGAITPSQVTTDQHGFVEARWTLGAVDGAQQVRASTDALQTVFNAIAYLDDGAAAGWLAFERNREIVLLDGEGTIHQLTNGGGQTAAHPAWSPAGGRIAFTRYDAGYHPSIYLMNADGSDPILWANDFEAPAWSPDGRMLAVQARGGCVYECDIWLMPTERDGTRPRFLVSQGAWPAWSPDGTMIAYVALSGDDGYHTVNVVNRDGSGVREVTLLDEGGISRPAWSPDGSRLAFSKCLQGRCILYTVSASATRSAAITALTDQGNVFNPAWSPDGRSIAVTVNLFPNSYIGVVPATGGVPVRVATPGQTPAWRPGSSRNGVAALQRQRPHGGCCR